jgi:Ca2+-binding RTX toxin-like protein
MAGTFRYTLGADYDGVGDGDLVSGSESFTSFANNATSFLNVGEVFPIPDPAILISVNNSGVFLFGYLSVFAAGNGAFVSNAGYLFDWAGESVPANFVGGDFGDWLFGGTAADTLRGGGGNDLTRGGAGNDTHDGGSGTDRVVFSGAVSDYLLISVGSTVTVTDLRSGSPDGVDTLTNVEFLTFSDITFALDLITTSPAQGGVSAEFLTGREGFTDVINGGDGGDFIQGLSGDDQLNGENGDDVLYGGAGDDLMAGGFGNDVLIGGEGQDQMHGEAGSDQLFGGGGQDDLRGGDGADFLSGGEGAFDFLSGGAGGDRFIITDTPSGTKEGTIDALLLDFSFAEGDRLDLGGVPGGGAGVLFTASDGFGFGPSTLVTLANGTQFVIVGQGVSDVQAGFASWVV